MKNHKLQFFIMLYLLLLAMGCKAKSVSIGIAKFNAAPSSEAIIQGLETSIRSEYPNANIQIRDAESQLEESKQIAADFASAELDLFVAIGTPAAESLVQKQVAPLFYGAVADPEGAGLLAPSLKATGFSDSVSLEKTFEAIRQLQPDLQTLGLVDSTLEKNSQFVIPVARYAAARSGIPSAKTALVYNEAQVTDAVSSLVDSENKVDALYIPSSNVLTKNMAAIIKVADRRQVPVYTADPLAAKEGAVFALGVDYLLMGEELGDLILQYLDDDESVFDTKVRSLPEEQVIYYTNPEAAQKYGLVVPAGFGKP